MEAPNINAESNTVQLDVAIAVCEKWFQSLENQKKKAHIMQQAAALAKQGDRQAALNLKNQADTTNIGMDGAKLEPAVRALVEHVKNSGK